jgi:hypothetical protein
LGLGAVIAATAVMTAAPGLWGSATITRRFGKAGEWISGWLFLALPVLGIAAPLAILWLANRVALSS